MSEVLGYLLLAAIAAFLTYRQYWVYRFARAQRGRRRGLRIVVSRSWASQQGGARTYGARTVRERHRASGGAADRHALAPQFVNGHPFFAKQHDDT